MTRTTSPVLRARKRAVIISLALLVGSIVATGLVYSKEAIGSFLRSGESITIEFERDYRLIPDTSDVKVSGVEVGVVTDVEPGDEGRSKVTVKIDDDAVDKLGTEPAAAIRPVTILGGKYYLELVPGGDRGRYDADKMIPASRTVVPVELDEILGSLTQPAREGVRSTVRQVDGTLANGGKEAIADLVADAPGTLKPAGPVLTSLQGTRPSVDLPQLVANLNLTASVLTEQDGQLGSIVDSLNTVSAGLRSSKDDLADVVRSLPETLRSTREGLGPLRASLTKLTTTAASFRPAAQRLGPLLAKADPVLRQALPVVKDLRPVLQQARPLVQELVPTSVGLTQALDHLRGPVLDRVNGPITQVVNSPWTGKGYYAGDGGNGHLLYQEVGYLAAHGANLSKYGDKNGQMVALALGVGASTVGGTNLTLEQLLENIGVLPPGTATSPPASAQPETSAPNSPSVNVQPGLGISTPVPGQNESGYSDLLAELLGNGSGR